MVHIIIIEKTGNIKQKNIAELNKSELYKQGGFKTAKDFEYQTSWKVELVMNEKKYIMIH